MVNKVYRFDPRDRQELVRQISLLAQSYTPEWAFSPEDPDIGGVLALLFAHLTESNIQKLNRLPEKTRVDLCNLLGASLRPARSAHSIVRFSVLPTADSGTYLPRGTKLYGMGEDDRQVTFETAQSIYATAAVVEEVFLSKQGDGIVTRLGDGDQSELCANLSTPDPGQNMVQNAIELYHPYLLRAGQGCDLLVHFIQSDGLSNTLSDPDRFCWYYSTAEGYRPFPRVTASRDVLRLKIGGDCAPLPEGELGMESIRCVAKEPLGSELCCGDLRLSTRQEQVEVEEVWCGDIKLHAQEFFPFGETLALLGECYLGCDPVLTQKGARVTLGFHLSFIERETVVTPDQPVKLKVIMPRRSKAGPPSCQVWAQRTLWEYFNGVGWNRLPVSPSWEAVFAGEHSGPTEISFDCPGDITPIELNAFEKNWLRLRVVQADNCYQPGARHHIPCITGLRFSHSFGDRGCRPAALLRQHDATVEEITRLLGTPRPCTLFAPLQMQGDCLLVGLNKRPEGAPISLFFDIVNPGLATDFSLSVEYSSVSSRGWKQLKAVDTTDAFAHSGALVFQPPADMQRREVYGRGCFWLRLAMLPRDSGRGGGSSITLRRLCLNGVEVLNQYTYPPEYFYLSPNENETTLQLVAQKVRDARVYVNEAILMTQPEMEAVAERGEATCVRDALGGIAQLFVPWQEVDSFDRSRPGDRHYLLDRVGGRVIFSDGKDAMSPPKQPDVAVMVVATACDGEAGNVRIGAINEAYDFLERIDLIENILPGYNGTDMETLPAALERASGMLRGNGRIVTRQDMADAVLTLSPQIAKAAVVQGLSDGSEGVTLLVLPYDYYKNTEVFFALRGQIRTMVLERCAFTLNPARFAVEQVGLMEISVSVWLGTPDGETEFERMRAVEERLESYLNPIGGNLNGSGWPIGTFPNKAQLTSVIGGAVPGCIVKSLGVTGRLENAHGVREYDLLVEGNPWAVCVSGQHHVYLY